MKKLFLILLVYTNVQATLTIDPKYDNFEGIPLILKLIADSQWADAEMVFEKDKREYSANSPADYYLVQGLLQNHKGHAAPAIDDLSASLKLNYSSLAHSKILDILTQQKDYPLGFEWLESLQTKSLGRPSPAAEINFLKSATLSSLYQTRSLLWLDTYLQRSYNFQVLKLYTEVLLKNQIRHEASTAFEHALEKNEIKSAEEVLVLAELFLNMGFDLELHHTLELARLKFPKSDLIKLNLAQILFKKDMNVSALNLLSEIKSDDGLINVKLELMNIMKVKSYSLFHQIQLQDRDLHLKNKLVYLINNEDWTILYSLHPNYKPASKWANDEFNYALAFSSQVSADPDQARFFANNVQNPQMASKKANLLKSIE